MARKKSQPISSKTRTRSKPLHTSADYVRTSVPAAGLPLVEAMGRAMTAYAEFPIRLMKCNSPAQLWREYLRFGQALFDSFAGLTHSELSGGEKGLRSGGRLHRIRRPNRARH